MAYKPPVNYRATPIQVVSEAFSVNANGRALLAETPADPANPATPMTVVVGGVARTRVTGAPAAGEYRVVPRVGGGFLPILEFNIADAAALGAVGYYGTGTIVTDLFFEELMVHIQGLIAGSAQHFMATGADIVTTTGLDSATMSLTVASVPPTFASLGSAYGGVPAGGTVTLVGVTTTGPSLILIAVDQYIATAGIASVTVGGAAATQRVAGSYAGGSSKVQIWSYWSPAALSAADIVVTTSAAASEVALIAVEAQGTSSGSATGTATATNSGSSATGTVAAVTTAAASVVFGAVSNWVSGNTAGVNTSNLQQRAGNTDIAVAAINTETTVLGNSYTITETFGAAGNWGAVALEIKP